MFLFDDVASLGGLLPVESVVYAVAAGIFLAFFAYWFLQNIVGKLVRRIAKKAVGEENAKTLDELDRNKGFYRFLLRDGSTLRSMISCVGGDLPRVGDTYEDSNLDSIARELSANEGEATLVSKEEKTSKNPFKRKPKADFSRAKFYVTEENAKKALHRYPHKVSILWVILALVLCVGLSIAAAYFVPIIISLFKNK